MQKDIKPYVLLKVILHSCVKSGEQGAAGIVMIE